MLKIGINILPCDEDFEHAGIPPKDKQAEEKAINDIAYSVCAFFIRSNPKAEGISVKMR